MFKGRKKVSMGAFAAVAALLIGGLAWAVGRGDDAGEAQASTTVASATLTNTTTATTLATSVATTAARTTVATTAATTPAVTPSTTSKIRAQTPTTARPSVAKPAMANR